MGGEWDRLARRIASGNGVNDLFGELRSSINYQRQRKKCGRRSDGCDGNCCRGRSGMNYHDTVAASFANSGFALAIG